MSEMKKRFLRYAHFMTKGVSTVSSAIEIFSFFVNFDNNYSIYHD